MSNWFEKEYQVPESLAVIWSPDVLTQAGSKPTRGFGGRVYFYNARSQAVPVDGDLIVHAYLTTPTIADHSQKVKADKTFAYTAEQLTGHFSPSELGASYSIWIPWDAEGGFREELTLIATFKTKAGGIVQSEPAKVFLPGKNRFAAPATEAKASTLEASTVTYRKSSTPTNNGFELPRSGGFLAERSANTNSSQPVQRNRLTTTISVPQDASLLKRKTSFTLGGGGATSVKAGKTTPTSAVPLLNTPNQGTGKKPLPGPSKQAPLTPSQVQTQLFKTAASF